MLKGALVNTEGVVFSSALVPHVYVAKILCVVSMVPPAAFVFYSKMPIHTLVASY